MPGRAKDDGKPGHPGLEDALFGIGTCQRCDLGKTRTNVVVGSGNPHARLMLIGEAPGRSEDLGGKPFTGAAGRMLDHLLECAGITRGEIYIANVLKCRPPKNRDPKPAEVKACTPWLEAQIDAVDPALIVTMGNFSTRFVLQTSDPISELRGRSFEARGRSVIPTFHPAAAIYDRSKVALLEEDFEAIGQALAGQSMTRLTAQA